MLRIFVVTSYVQYEGHSAPKEASFDKEDLLSRYNAVMYDDFDCESDRNVVHVVRIG